MIMERMRGGMRLSEYANNSLSCSQDKQHHELNDRILDERLHHRKTGHLLGMHGSSKRITCQRKLVLSILGGTKRDTLKRCPGRRHLEIAVQQHIGYEEKEQKAGSLCVQFHFALSWIETKRLHWILTGQKDRNELEAAKICTFPHKSVHFHRGVLSDFHCHAKCFQ